MKPYYQDSLVAIFNGECEYKKSDVIVLDSPCFLKDVWTYDGRVLFIFTGREHLGNYAMDLWQRRLNIIPWVRRIADKGEHFPYVDLILAVGNVNAKVRPYYDMLPISERFQEWERPVELLVDLLVDTTGDILDPFLGSGTTAVAAKTLNRKCVGYDIDEKCCEIAAERCRQCV